MERKEPRKINVVLDNTLRELGLYEGIKQVELFRLFKQLIGPQAAAACSGMELLNNGVFKVHVLSDPLRSQLYMQRLALLDHLNRQWLPKGGRKIIDIVLW